MPHVHWIIQENNRTVGTVGALVEAVQANGDAAHLVTLEDGLPIPPVEQLPRGAPLVCHGPGFVTRALTDPRYQSGLYFDRATFRWSAFQANWGQLMLARDGKVVSLEAALAMVDSRSKFVRPDADSKAFDGGIYDGESLRTITAMWRGKITESVVVSEPIQIDAEWRLFIVEDRVIASSQYRLGGKATIDGIVPREVVDLGLSAAALWSPAPVYCLDIARSDKALGIVEANCFNASRLYGGDVGDIVRNVSVFALAHSQNVR